MCNINDDINTWNEVSNTMKKIVYVCLRWFGVLISVTLTKLEMLYKFIHGSFIYAIYKNIPRF